MADNHKYYYLKLKENFFESDNMILLETVQDGYIYSNILMKLYLRSLKDEGRLMLGGKIPYSPQMLATITRHQVGTMEKALNMFMELGLIEILENGAIYISDIQDFIGTGSTEAERKANYRKRIKAEEDKKLLMGQCPDNRPDNRPPELDIDIDIKKDICEIETVDEFYENIWNLYPNKKGKNQVKAKQKKELFKIGFEVISRCIERYKKDKESWREWQNGSTFFNSGYIDYLDENYLGSTPEKHALGFDPRDRI